MSELTTTPQEFTAASSLFFDVAKFAHAQRVANMFSQSTMIPDQFRGNIGNCVIALNLAERYRLDPFMVMQKMYIIHGRPGIEAQLAIALINSSGKFTPLEFEISGEGDNRQCFAYATKKADGKTLKGPVVSIKMAKDEGWMGKSGSKWKTMPDLMLTYRSATFFGRIYAPEALMGLSTNDELEDIQPMKNITPKAKPEPLKAIGESLDMYEPDVIEVKPQLFGNSEQLEPSGNSGELSGNSEQLEVMPETDKNGRKIGPYKSQTSESLKEQALERLQALSEKYPDITKNITKKDDMNTLDADTIHARCDVIEDEAANGYGG